MKIVSEKMLELSRKCGETQLAADEALVDFLAQQITEEGPTHFTMVELQKAAAARKASRIRKTMIDALVAAFEVANQEQGL